MASFSPAEWRARQQLAGCCRVLAHLRWTDLLNNHVSLRVPGPIAHYLTNPSGLDYTEVCASNLVKVDLEGEVIGRSERGVNPAGFVLHAAVHGGIEHAHCVIHTQTTQGMAVASSAQGLSFGNVYAAQLAGRVAYHQFHGLGINPGEGERLVADIEDKPAVILRNRGLLAWGETLPKAFSTLWALQRACDVQVAGAGLGPTVPVPELVQRRSTEEAIRASASPEFGLDVFDALVRQVDRYDQSWRS